MSNSFLLTIVTPEREVYRDNVDSVTLPTIEGEITVLAHHVPLSTILKPGELVIRKDSDTKPYAIGGGFIEVQGDKLTVLADTAEHIEELEEQRVQEALARAEKLKTEIHQDHVEYAALAAKLERDVARMRIIKKYRHRGHSGISHEAIRKE